MLQPALPIGAAVPAVASVAEIESEDEADCIEVPDLTDESDQVERNELGNIQWCLRLIRYSRSLTRICTGEVAQKGQGKCNFQR